MKKDKASPHVGFTLVELIIVLAIISAMVKVLLPYATRSNDSLKVKQQCLDMAEVIKYAIDLAINTRKSTRITINPKNKSYLLEMATQTNSYQPIEGFHGTVRYISRAANIMDIQGFCCDANDQYLIFDPTGKWPDASISLSTEDSIETIKIRGRCVEIEESTI